MIVDAVRVSGRYPKQRSFFAYTEAAPNFGQSIITDFATGSGLARGK
jgi:hypothetical protein